MSYPTDLTPSQKQFISDNFHQILRTKSKSDVFELLNAIFYVIKSGCQWRMLPKNFPIWSRVYYFYRRWSDKAVFQYIMTHLVMRRRETLFQSTEASIAVIDSQSCKWGLSDSIKGFDGFKRVKGIKRTIAVDENGYPLTICVTTANLHDSRIAYITIPQLLEQHSKVRQIKGDKGYAGDLGRLLRDITGVDMKCVKSNFGSMGFVPVDGRWVVERTFSWLENYRRLNRNYERFLNNAKNVTVIAFVMFMLRYV